MKQIPAWIRDRSDDAAFMELVLSNAQGELSPLERGMHALAATKEGKQDGRSVDAYARVVGRPKASVHLEVCAARVAEMSACGDISSLANRTRHLAEIHAAPEPCWPALVNRLLDSGWTVVETTSAVKAVLAVKPPRGYEKLFAVEELQDLAAAGTDPSEATRASVRAAERGRADILDVQFASDEHAGKFESWLTERGGPGAPWDLAAVSTDVDRQTSAGWPPP